MAFSFDGAVTNFANGTSDPITLTMNATVNVGKVILVVFGGDSASISLTGVTDSNGHTWDTSFSSAGQGNVGLAWARVTDQMVSGVDTISINFSSSNDSYATAYQLSGVTEVEDVDGTKTYTTGSNYSHGLTSSDEGVQFEAFIFPYDYGFSSGCKAATGWTLGGEMDPGSDQTLLMFYKEVTAGTDTCTGACALSHLASGVVLPYTASLGGSQVVFVG